MFLRNKLRLAYNTLKSKSGVSLIFVLGIMMMLFAIGGAVLTGASSSIDIGSSVMGAASANFGSNIRQNNYNSAVLLNDSIHKTIRYSLLDSTANDSLSRIIPKLIYDNMDAIEQNQSTSPVQDLEFVLNLTGIVDGIIDPANYTVKMIFPVSANNPSIAEDGPRGFREDMNDYPEDTKGNRRPYAVTINATIIFEVEVEITSPLLTGTGNRFFTTQATYTYSNGVFWDKWNNNPGDVYDPYNPDYPINPTGIKNREDDETVIGTMVLKDTGTWVLTRYEITQSHD